MGSRDIIKYFLFQENQMFEDFENPIKSNYFSAMDIVLDLTPSQVTADDEKM